MPDIGTEPEKIPGFETTATRSHDHEPLHEPGRIPGKCSDLSTKHDIWMSEASYHRDESVAGTSDENSETIIKSG